MATSSSCPKTQHIEEHPSRTNINIIVKSLHDIIKTNMTRHESPKTDAFIEPFTRREREFLALLADFNLAIQDIAAQMTIAPNSARWYARQIYAKLGVNSRHEAIRKATELQLIHSDLPDIRCLHNIPAPLTSFFGRKIEIQIIKKMLKNPEIRIVTLIGAGGVGKTRLATKVAEEMIETFQQGIWLIELAPLSDGDVILDETAAVLGVNRTKERDLMTVLIEFLKTKNLLLIFDNCEHLLNPFTPFAEKILRACPFVKILATSRETLEISGERVFNVPPLSFPNQSLAINSLNANQYEAVNLFIDRAQIVQPNFMLSEENGKSIIKICQKLDGIPLALELAAARIKVLDVTQIAERLDNDISLLVGGGRSSLPRYKTMYASIDWSYQLLPPEQKHILHCLSIFAGGWSVEAAQAIYMNIYHSLHPSEHFHPIDFLNIFSMLLDKSLFVLSSHSYLRDDFNPATKQEPVEETKKRYRMLEPIQQFVTEKLLESGEEYIIRRCHLAYFLNLAETAGPVLHTARQASALTELGLENENFRRSLEWAMKKDVESGLRLASALMWFWHLRGRWKEGIDWLLKGLDAGYRNYQLPDKKMTSLLAPNTLIRARALRAAGFLQGNGSIYEFETASAMLKESLSIFQRNIPQDRTEIAFILLHLSRNASRHISHNQLLSWVNQSLSIYGDLKDQFGISESLLVLAENEWNTARAQEAFKEILLIKRRCGDIDGIALTLFNYAGLLISEGNINQAENILLESLDAYRKIGNDHSVIKVLLKLGWISWVKGFSQHGLKRMGEAKEIALQNNDSVSVAIYLSQICDIFRSEGNYETAEINTFELCNLSSEINNKIATALCLLSQAKNELLKGNIDQAINQIENTISLEREFGNRAIKVESLYLLGEAHCALYDYTHGKTYFLKSLVESYAQNDWHDWISISFPLAALARLLSSAMNLEGAAMLLGAADRRFPFWQNTLSAEKRLIYQNVVNQMKSAMGQENFDRAHNEGDSMFPEKIIQFVLMNRHLC
jgi:predicted ATPase/DNA-binding CsgD family transcriptional regulator